MIGASPDERPTRGGYPAAASDGRHHETANSRSIAILLRSLGLLLLLFLLWFGTAQAQLRPATTSEEQRIKNQMQEVIVVFKKAQAELPAASGMWDISSRPRIDYYDELQVRHLITTTHSWVRESLTGIGPLQEYADDYFGEAQGTLQDKPVSGCLVRCVTAKSVQRAFAIIDRGNTKITAASQLVIVLKTWSEPATAQVSLFIQNRPEADYQTSTNDPLAGVWRGKYLAHVEKAGYKRGELRLNLIDDNGTVLKCQLALVSETRRASNCWLSE